MHPFLFWIFAAASVVLGFAPTADERSCQVNADCTIVPLTCCNCSSGGKGVAINKRERSHYEQRHAKSCGRISTCVAMMSSHWSCMGTPICMEHSCQIAWAAGSACKVDADCASFDVDSICKPEKLHCGPARCIKGACSVVPRWP